MINSLIVVSFRDGFAVLDGKRFNRPKPHYIYIFWGAA